MSPLFQRPKFAMIVGALLLAGCAAPQLSPGLQGVIIEVDGLRLEIAQPPGTTVLQALNAAAISLGELDRLEPPGYTVVSDETLIRVIRVSERFELETIELPFIRQTIRSEILPQGDVRLLQSGLNGREELTYRIVIENGVEVSRAAVKRSLLSAPQPEILMIGTQASYTPVELPGRIAYLSAGNAWLMEGSSGRRSLIYSGGDLDGQVFELSPDGAWLLFTRAGEQGEINSLWLLSTAAPDPTPIDLQAANVVHFAGWAPDGPPYRIAYSTVEPRAAAPGWQANNDLQMVTFDPAQGTHSTVTILETNAGGQYGWWGTSFLWAPNGLQLAYARADSVGIVDLENPRFDAWYSFSPYQTGGDWAWVPGISWSRDGESLFTVAQGELRGGSESSARFFEVIALLEAGDIKISLSPRSGMFAAPITSPLREYSIAYLEADAPTESQSSKYRLAVIDRDGSNHALLFPPPGEQGLEPQRVRWSPGGDQIAVIYRQDLWIVDLASGAGQRVTGDGQLGSIDWVP